MFVSVALKSDRAWDEKGSGVGRREKIVSVGVENNIGMAAPVLLKNSKHPTQPLLGLFLKEPLQTSEGALHTRSSCTSEMATSNDLKLH